jgi:N-acetylmuramoyl-L-alanine amidase
VVRTALLLPAVGLTAALLLGVPAPSGAVPARPAGSAVLRTAAPLTGVTIVVDPGHQLGNATHPQECNRLVDAGGFRKPCNTVGTSTDGGYPEATFAFRVAARLRDRLESLGAHVVMTRNRNSRELWGPCVDVRGRIGNKGYRGRLHDADLKVSIHGDGSAAGNRGFHVIVATKQDSRAASTHFAKTTRRALERAGFPRSNYVGGGTALDYRGDLGTLNLSHFPTIMVELGNMRNRRDAALMTSPTGRRHYARALLRGIRSQLDL